MEILLALFVFQQIPVTYADTTWPMYGATLENTHFQKMVGAMETAPYVKWSYVTGLGGIECHGAAVADVDGDDTMEVVIGSYFDCKVYCLNGVTGLVKWSYLTGRYVYSSATIADVDGVAGMEVVIGSLDDKVYCLNGADGIVKWSYLTGDAVFSSPAVADVDGVAGMEVVVGSFDDKVYCLNGADGTVKWSYLTGGNVYSSPAVADVDGVAGMEVVIGSDNHKVYCLNGVTGLVKWSYKTGNVVHSSPAVADVDGIAGMEVVVGSQDKKVYCLDGVTGLVKWSYATGRGVHSSPAAADVDGDGNMEVVIGSCDNKVYCLNGADGTVKWSYNAGGFVHRGISVADLDGDVSGECKLEILVPNVTSDLLVCLNGEDGLVLWTKQLAQDVHDITIADIDNDGCVELVVGTQSENKIWALDDVLGASDCKCGSNNVEESKEFRVQSSEFRVMGRGVYLFTPNAISVDIKLYDICGRLKQVLYNGVLSKGGHTFMPNIKDSGVYFVILQINGCPDAMSKYLKIIRF